jgi:hypothetical protein
LLRYEKPDKLLTDLGRTIALQRFEAMRGFLDRLSQELADGGGDKPAAGIIRFLGADAHRPSLLRQVAKMESVLRDGQMIDGLEPSDVLQRFVEVLRAEIVGDR